MCRCPIHQGTFVVAESVFGLRRFHALVGCSEIPRRQSCSIGCNTADGVGLMSVLCSECRSRTAWLQSRDRRATGPWQHGSGGILRLRVSLPDSLWVVTAQPMSRMSSWGAAGVQCSSLGWHVILSLSPVHGQQRLRLAAWAVNVSACENRLVPVLEIAGTSPECMESSGAATD